MTRPSVEDDRPWRSERARSLRWKPSAAIASPTRSAVAEATPASALMTRDTVFKLTPAFSATSRMVGLVADSDASFVLLLQMRLTTMSDNDVKPLARTIGGRGRGCQAGGDGGRVAGFENCASRRSADAGALPRGAGAAPAGAGRAAGFENCALRRSADGGRFRGSAAAARAGDASVRELRIEEECGRWALPRKRRGGAARAARQRRTHLGIGEPCGVDGLHRRRRRTPRRNPDPI